METKSIDEKRKNKPSFYLLSLSLEYSIFYYNMKENRRIIRTAEKRIEATLPSFALPHFILPMFFSSHKLEQAQESKRDFPAFHLDILSSYIFSATT